VNPNLSGLFTEHDPVPAGDSWAAERLWSWVPNPREARFFARMLPVSVRRMELSGLAEVWTEDRARRAGFGDDAMASGVQVG